LLKRIPKEYQTKFLNDTANTNEHGTSGVGGKGKSKMIAETSKSNPHDILYEIQSSLDHSDSSNPSVVRLPYSLLRYFRADPSSYGRTILDLISFPPTLYRPNPVHYIPFPLLLQASSRGKLQHFDKLEGRSEGTNRFGRVQNEFRIREK